MKFFSSVVLAVAAIAACADAQSHDKKNRAQRNQGNQQQHPEGRGKTKEGQLRASPLKGQLRASPLLEPKVDATVGTNKVVVVRIKTILDEPTISSADLSDKVFGTHGDEENLKSQYAGCSHGKFQILKATGNGIIDGVTEVNLTQMASTGVSCTDLAEEAERMLMQRWGTNDWTEIIEFMMFVCPPGATDGFTTHWCGYAEGVHRSYYKDEEILSAKMQVHEFGHNLRLDHSNEKGEWYGDNTGMMGISQYHDEGKYAKVCFNPAKSWQLGWYRDKSITVDPKASGEEYIGKIVGVNNYDKVTGKDKVILKVPGIGGKDYFIGFNHADGFNEGTFEAANQVTVVEQEVPESQNWDHRLYSNLKAKLAPGGSYTTATGVVIKVMKVVTTPNTGYAMVQICADDSCSTTPTCKDEAGWKDDGGYFCPQWEGKDCLTYGNDMYTGVSMTANQACCSCDGGTM